ncbi:MAG: methyl-accepting chemotaxis protein [Chloroflexi bacterium]|nr:methyl-accepting chemotaxis protein [Chloroflexota bacterium]
MRVHGAALRPLRSTLPALGGFRWLGIADWTLSTRLAVLMSLVATVAIGVSIASGDARMRADLATSQRTALLRAARDTAARIDARLLERLATIQTLARAPQIARYVSDTSSARPQDLADVRATLRSLNELETFFDGAYIVDAKGQALLSAGNPLNVNLGDRAFFTQITTRDGKPAVSDVELTAATGKRVLYYGAPLRGDSLDVRAVLVLRVLMDDIDTLVDGDKGRVGDLTYGTLWDRNAIRLHSGLDPAQDLTTAGPLSADVQTRLRASLRLPNDRAVTGSDAALAARIAETRTNQDFTLNGRDGATIVASQPLANVPWVYTIQQPESAALAALNASTGLSWMIFALAVLATLGVSLALSRLVVRPLNDLQRVANAIRGGDYSARAAAPGKDEIGQVAASLNRMLDEVTGLIQTRDERDRIQQQIIKLLGEVSSAAEGDLTVEAEVTDGELGSVADAFNYMVSELRRIIENVNDTTVKLNSSTGEILAASSLLVRGATTQARQIADVTRNVDDLSQSISVVAERALQGSEVAQAARVHAQRGREAVRGTVEGMQRIRAQARSTAKQIKRLGESSQEIGQIVEIIEGIAEQTNLLALNAAIQAAMAGEHGRGFAVVADEVRRLSERAATSANQISTLVKSIQAETAESVIAMESSTREVVEGSRLTDLAGRSLDSLDGVVQQLAELSAMISSAADQQAAAARSIARSMSEISEATQTTSVGSQQTADSVGYLARLSEQLRSSVATFRLSQHEGSHA